MRSAIVIAAALLLPSPAVAQDKRAERYITLVKRPVPEVEPLVVVTGDSLDPSVTVSTKGATVVVNKGLIASTTEENSFFRGFIDKKTGSVSAQIYHRITYGGSGWQFYNRASYENAGVPEEAEALQVGSDVSCARYGCTHFEDVAVPVPFAVLEAAAGRFNPASPVVGFRYRLFSKAGNTIDDAIPGNEVVAFVNVMHRERDKLAKP